MEGTEIFKRDFKGVWIPREIWLDSRLNALDKVIFTEIDSLDNDEEGCYATNEHIATFCQCSTRKVTDSISKLIELGYLYVASFDGRKRYLKSSLAKFASLPSKNCESASQNLLESNTINIINNNNSNNINNNIYEDNYNNNIYIYIEQNFGRTLNPIEYEVISHWEDNELTRYAIKQAVLKGVYNIKYISTVLSNYEKNSIKTVQQAQEQEKQFKERKNNNDKPMSASEKRQEMYKRLEEKYDNSRN